MSAAARRRRQREQPLEDWMAVGRDDGEGVVDRLVGDDRNRTLWRAVAELPPHQRRLVLAFSQESPPSYQEVADAMSIPIGSIGPTRARALSRLKTMLADQGIRDAGLDRAA
jgi:DNA-directed RNA polymerase specialized sigma24 family protein